MGHAGAGGVLGSAGPWLHRGVGLQCLSLARLGVVGGRQGSHSGCLAATAGVRAHTHLSGPKPQPAAYGEWPVQWGMGGLGATQDHLPHSASKTQEDSQRPLDSEVQDSGGAESVVVLTPLCSALVLGSPG